MKPRNIGGSLNYELLARKHQPSDPAALAAEIRRLHANGLTAHDISAALRLNVVAVLEILREGA